MDVKQHLNQWLETESDRTQEGSSGGRWSWAVIAGLVVLLLSFSSTANPSVSAQVTQFRTSVERAGWGAHKLLNSHWRGPHLLNMVVLVVGDGLFSLYRSERWDQLFTDPHPSPRPPPPPPPARPVPMVVLAVGDGLFSLYRSGSAGTSYSQIPDSEALGRFCRRQNNAPDDSYGRVWRPEGCRKTRLLSVHAYYTCSHGPISRSMPVTECHSLGAVWKSRWTSWAVRPNEPSGFRGRKELSNLFLICQLTSEDIKHQLITAECCLSGLDLGWTVSTQKTHVQVQCCFTSTETVRIIRDGEPKTAISTFTQFRFYHWR